MRGLPMKWTKCPGCQRVVPVMPLAGSDPVVYRLSRHNSHFLDEARTRPVMCPLSITSADGPIYHSQAEVPNG